MSVGSSGRIGREQLSDALHLEALAADGGRPGGGEHRGDGDVFGVAAGGCMRDGVAEGGEDGAALSWGGGRREACCRRRERGGGDAIIFAAVRCHHRRWGRECIEGGVRRIERELEWCEWLGKIALFFVNEIISSLVAVGRIILFSGMIIDAVRFALEKPFLFFCIPRRSLVENKFSSYCQNLK